MVETPKSVQLAQSRAAGTERKKPVEKRSGAKGLLYTIPAGLYVGAAYLLWTGLTSPLETTTTSTTNGGWLRLGEHSWSRPEHREHGEHLGHHLNGHHNYVGSEHLWRRVGHSQTVHFGLHTVTTATQHFNNDAIAMVVGGVVLVAAATQAANMVRNYLRKDREAQVAKQA